MGKKIDELISFSSVRKNHLKRGFRNEIDYLRDIFEKNLKFMEVGLKERHILITSSYNLDEFCIETVCKCRIYVKINKFGKVLFTIFVLIPKTGNWEQFKYDGFDGKEFIDLEKLDEVFPTIAMIVS